jgi:SAM-dependent methyltransferase
LGEIVAIIYSAIGRVSGAYDLILHLVGYERSVNFFVSKLPFADDQQIKVLDAGCGTGLYTMAVLRKYKNGKVTAFDFDPTLVARLQEKARQENFDNRLEAFNADIGGSLSELQQKFDLIITSGVLEYVPLKNTVASLSRFLVPSGYFFNSPVKNNLYGKIIAGIYGCAPYPRENNIAAFGSDYHLETIIKLSPFSPASYKEAHLFRKL